MDRTARAVETKMIGSQAVASSYSCAVLHSRTRYSVIADHVIESTSWTDSFEAIPEKALPPRSSYRVGAFLSKGETG